MPAWIASILKALAVPFFEWVGGAIKSWIASAKEASDRRTLDKKQKKRAELTRALQIAKEKGDAQKIQELSVALVLLDTE